MRCYPTSPPEKIGLIGLGLMGIAIAERLNQKDQPILGFDILKPQRDRIASIGLSVASDPAEIFRSCQTVILSLPSHLEVAEILEANDSHFRSGLYLVDTSTGDPEHAQSFARRLKTRAVSYIDATVSGNSEQLAHGSAVFLVGASENDFVSICQLLSLLSEKVIRVGDPGSGARLKLVTNLVLGLNRAALAEGLSYAFSMGLDLPQVLGILRESMAYSRIMDSKGEKMIQRDFLPQARLSQHLKDVRLIMETANKTGCWLPLSSTHKELLDHGVSRGMGDWDNSALFEVLRQGKIGPEPG